MKRVIFILAIGLTACDTATVDEPAKTPAPKAAQSAPATAAPAEVLPETAPEHGYDNTWHLSNWPGEWPNSFAITGENVTVQGRAKIDLEAPKSIDCPLPQFAHYHPWNTNRYDADALDYQSANQIERITVSEAVSINVDPVEPPAGSNPESPRSEQIVIDLAAGDSFEVIAYASEGYAILRHKGVEYGGFPYHLEVPSTIEPENSKTHLWVNALCQNGERAWLRYEDVLDVEGIDIGEPSGYGIAHDLDHPEYPKR